MEDKFIDKDLIKGLIEMISSKDPDSKQLFWGIFNNIIESDKAEFFSTFKKYAEEEAQNGNTDAEFVYYNLIIVTEWDEIKNETKAFNKLEAKIQNIENEGFA